MKLKTFLKKRGITQAEFARQMGVTQGAVWQWLNNRGISPKKALEVEALTEGAVSRHELLPEIFAVEKHSRSHVAQ